MSDEWEAVGLSEALRALPGRLEDQRPALGDILLALDDRALALALLLFSIPAIVPTPGVPAGALFGSALAVIGLQMTFGAKRFRLPPSIARWRIARGQLERVVGRTVPQIERLERRLQARSTGFVNPRILGMIVFVMAVLIALPIPFGNTLPGLAVLFMALGLAQRDGLAIMAGLGLAIAAGIASTALIGGSWWLIESALAA